MFLFFITTSCLLFLLSFLATNDGVLILNKQHRVLSHYRSQLSAASKDPPDIPNAQWKEYKLPKSFLTVSVLEAVDMDLDVSQAIEHSSFEPFGLMTWYATLV